MMIPPKKKSCSKSPCKITCKQRRHTRGQEEENKRREKHRRSSTHTQPVPSQGNKHGRKQTNNFCFFLGFWSFSKPESRAEGPFMHFSFYPYNSSSSLFAPREEEEGKPFTSLVCVCVRMCVCVCSLGGRA